MAFEPRFLDEIRARLSLADIIGRKVKLTKRGREYVGLCPFHNEKTPSFTVVEDKGFFHCFGCGAHGDVIGFEMQANSLSFPEAVEKLAGEAGLEIPKETPEEREKAKTRATLIDVMELACAFYEKQLRMPAGRAALDYLKGRGLDDEIIARFRLGFAPTGNALKAHLAREGVDEALMREAGLIGIPDGGRSPYDYFRDRVLFPITDRRGRVIAFGGRVMGDGKPKYLNSPESPVFHKGAVLYGLAQARGPAHDTGRVIVAEGYMDVIAFARAGMAYAVAPLGTALTEAQMMELWKLAPEPTLCFDGDNAGRRAAQRAAERALPVLKAGASLRFAMLPPGQDPDDLLKHEGAEAVARVLDGALPLSDAVWNMVLEGHSTDTPERRAKFERDLFALINTIGDEVVRDHYRTVMRDRIWETFKRRGGGKEGGRSKGRVKPRGRFAPEPPRPEIPGAPPALPRIVERSLAAVAGFVLRHPPVFERHVDDIAAVFEAGAPYGDLITAAVGVLSETPDMEAEALVHALEEAGHARVLAAALAAAPRGTEEMMDHELEEELGRMMGPLQELALQREAESLLVEVEAGDESAWARWQTLHAELERLRAERGD